MEKLANTQHEIHPLLKARWSPRAFDSRPLDPSVLPSLFEAARWAPSGGNNQPWAFVVFPADGSEARRQIEDALTGNNREWAPRAPLLVLAVAMPHPRLGTVGPYSYYDLGQAVTQLTVQATALGLFVHQMAGFDADKARQVAGLPDTCEPMVMIAIGHYGDYTHLSEALRERELAPRVRKPLAEFVFHARWGQSLFPAPA
ncbi:MAG: nitroreductase family protein [Anaerolineae bacterium]|nr:nitroreductase family protein [Thermoflexales bacterium]MDW8408416.1 nitroreductase family protein [Anaerolineae bacterium]